MKKNIILLIVLFFLINLFPYTSEARIRRKKQWKFIVIHHSATPNGSLQIFDQYHREKRHMTNGVAYHFVVCNGTNGKKDGRIQTSMRWKKQIPGGHCKKKFNNHNGIGICVVGNCQKKGPTEKQFWSLVWLTKKLMRENGISSRRVLGHKDMSGEQTKCPGKRFPWKRFYKAIRS